MIIRNTSESELEQISIETFINSVTGVTKISDHSAVRGLIRGNVRIAKMALKDMMLAISRLYPDLAYDTTLDQVADDHGIAARFGAAQSSTYIRIIADEGTIYQQGVHTVSDSKGNIFDLDNDLTIGEKGYDYVKVRSQQSGLFTNVDPYTIVNVNPEPSGHTGVINEYGATGGRDEEDDDIFRQRIKEGPDVMARGTLAYLGQAFMRINPNVLRVIYEGTNQQGKVVLGILTVNGIDLTSDELNTLLEQGGQYLSITELAPIGTTSYGVGLKNVEYFPIDVSMRLGISVGSSFESIVQEIQQRFQKYVDYRFWTPIDTVLWTDLLAITKGISGVTYVPDAHFSPLIDIKPPVNQMPRFRGFLVRDLQGNVVINQSGSLQSLFYPSDPDVSFVSSILS